MNILVVGSDVNAYSLCKDAQKYADSVFMAPGFCGAEDVAEKIDVSATDTARSADFALENDIDYTFVTSFEAIDADIAGFFERENLKICAPCVTGCEPVFSRALCKRIFHSENIPTLRFSIFDKEQKAVNYLQKADYPILLKPDNTCVSALPVEVENFAAAKIALLNLFAEFPSMPVVAEKYVNARVVYLYFAVNKSGIFPVGTCCSSEDSFCPTTVNAPDVYLPDGAQTRVLRVIRDKILKNGCGYRGIIGAEVVTDGNDFFLTELIPFFKQIHMQTLQPLLKISLFELFCGICDDKNIGDIFNSDCAACTRIVNDFEKFSDVENFLTAGTTFGNGTVTARAATFSGAVKLLDEFGVM